MYRGKSNENILFDTASQERGLGGTPKEECTRKMCI